MYMIRLCSDGAAYEAIPKRRLRVDISEFKLSLEQRGDCEILMWTPQLVVVRRSDDIEVTVIDDGRMIIRNVADENAARIVAERMLASEPVENR